MDPPGVGLLHDLRLLRQVLHRLERRSPGVRPLHPRLDLLVRRTGRLRHDGGSHPCDARTEGHGDQARQGRREAQRADRALDHGKRRRQAGEKTLTAPVTSASTCDAAPTPTGQVGTSLTVSEPMACTVHWHAVDHYEGIGWAPKGKVLLIATVTPNTPQLTFTKGDGFLTEQSYSQVEHVSLTATLDGKTADVISGDNSDSWGKRHFIVATPINVTEKPTKLAMKITWTSNAFGSQMTGFPSKVTGTLPATVSSLDSTTTIKTGPTPN